MARVARIVFRGVPQHVTQRDNNRQDVFFVEQGRSVYLAMLSEECLAAIVQVLNYCLMSNHVHLMPTPQREQDLARAAGRTHWRYSQYVNRLRGRSDLWLATAR